MSHTHLTLRQLRAFCLVAQEQSMTRAAEKLFLTTSALSMLIRSLEEELGLKLFERTTRRVALTDAGSELLPTALRTLDQLDSTVDLLRATHLKQGEVLKIATSPLLAASLMPAVISQFRLDFPGVRVELLDVPVADVAEAVRSGQADIGVCTSGQENRDLKSDIMFQDALAAMDSVEWADLVEFPLILLKPGTGLRNLLEKPMQRWAGQFRLEYEVANIHTALGLISAGLGVSVLPAYSLARAGIQGITARPLTNPQVIREVVTLFAASKPLPSSAEAFLNRFKKFAAQTPMRA
jgi:LysR family carnitine catabolism transcriptional activator